MPVRKNIPEAVKVRERFVRSLIELQYRGLVSTKNEFCKEVGLSNSGNLLRMQNAQREPGVTNILLLHKKYGVSLDWLMLGKGEFLEKENKK